MTKQHDHSENGTYRLTSEGQTTLIYPDGCVENAFELCDDPLEHRTCACPRD